MSRKAKNLKSGLSGFPMRRAASRGAAATDRPRSIIQQGVMQRHDIVQKTIRHPYGLGWPILLSH
jgi:hypothetical protein